MNKETRLIDNFRQKYFNIYINTNHESIQDFFQEVHNNLEKDLEYDAACELFSSILACFSSFSEYSLPFLNEFLDKFKSNQNYILITSSILLELTHDKRQLNIPHYQNLIDDCLNEVFPQISNDEMVIFGHKIQQYFLNTLFLNLFSLSNLTQKQFQIIFPYIFFNNIYANNQKFDLALQNLIKSGYIQLNPLNDDSNKDLLEILIHDLKIPNKIDENTLLFFTMSVIFTKSGGEMEINGLSVENILPFTALTILYHQKLQPIKKMTFSKINGLLINSIASLNSNTPVFTASINIILNNLEYLFNQDLIPVDSIIQIVIVLLKKLIDKEFYADKLLLLSIFFNYSNYELYEPFKRFVETNQSDLFDLIFHHLTEIENRIHYSLNFKIFESNLLYEHIQKLTKTEDIIQVLYFIDNYCTNLPILSDSFEKLINEKIEGEKLNNVSFLSHFMKKNGIQINAQEKSIAKNFLFENDEIITYLLIDCHPEEENQYDQQMQNLLTKMLNDKEIYNNYIFCSTYFLTTKNLTIPSYLELFINEYEQNPNDFMNIVNQFYFFDSKKNILEFNTHFSSTSLPNSEFGYSIISKLLDIANEKPGNYRVFLCLKNIAQPFPFLFDKDYQKVFDIVLKQLDSFYLLFENDVNEKSLKSVKTGFLALFFLLSTLQLPCILDKFIDWLFIKIQSFSSSQIFGFFSILLNIKYQKLLLLIYSKMIKFDFITTCKKLLEKEIGNEAFRSFYMKQISEFVSKVYTNLIKYIFSDENKTKYLQIIEYSKLEQAINYVCNTTYCQNFKFPHFNFIFESELFSKQFATFLYKVDLTKNINTNKKPTESQINAFKSKIKTKLFKYAFCRDKRITNLKKNDKNIDHLLIPIFKSYLSFMSCSLINYKLDLNLSEVLNQFNDDDDYMILILESFIEYLVEFSSNEIGSKNIKSMHQLINIFEMITEARIDHKDIFYPYINKLINIILLPKWRIDSFFISKVIFLLARLHILPIYTTKIILGKSNTQQFNRSNYNSYSLYNEIIEKTKTNLTDTEKIDSYKFRGNVGITNINTLYSYILIDNNCYEQEINKNIEEEVEFEKAEIFYQYSYLIERLYEILEIDQNRLYSIQRSMFIGEKLFKKVLKCNFKKQLRYIIGSNKVEKWIFYLLFKKASDLDCAYMNIVIYYYIMDSILFINRDKNLKYLEKAAESGIILALKHIATIIMNKNEKHKLKNISKWIEKTIKISSEIMFEYGESLFKNGNKKEGLNYIKEAADNGNLQAISFLHYEYKKEKGYLENSPEFFINEAKKYKQILMDYKQDNNKVFVDESFPAFENWKRIDEIYKAPLFQKDLIDPSFVNQGKLGDCYLICAFSRIAKQHYLVPLLFERKLPNSILGHVSNSINIKCGAVVVYFQAFGQRLPVLVDTLIPVDKKGKSIASRPSDPDKSPWFIIVEKAFAKLNGSYNTICGGHFSRSLYSLFFCCPNQTITIPSFDFIMEKQKEGCIMSTSLKEGNKDVSLPAHHSFLILKVRSYKGVNLIFCRNPWGTRGFYGKYCRYSDEWTPELKKAFNYDYHPPGTFWISYDELHEYFDKLGTIQPINPEWYIKMAQFKLISSPEDKLKRYSTKTHQNRKKYVVQIKDNIPFGEDIHFYFIVERRNSIFTSSNIDKSSKYELVISSNVRSHFKGGKIVEAFEYTFKNIRSFRFLINRTEQSDLTENFYVNVVCKYKFDVFDTNNSTDFAQTIINPGIVFENYTLSNPEISKKLKLKIFNKKFILSLDEEKSNLNDEKDEQIKNLFSYINMDFSSSFINLKELYTFTKTLIGNGTYSNVYIVNDKETNKQYAAKILKYSIDEMPVQFLNELNVLRSLRYPSIIKFIGFSDKNFKDENYPTIIVEYLKNGSLLDLLNEVHKGNKELTNTKKMMILLGVALGIEYLHKHGIIHCDLKLENILLDDDLNPKICDFGDSKHLSLDTNNTQNIGTPLYMAPEVINGQPHSFLSDVYSFGVIVYYLYTNQMPNVNEPINKSIIKSDFVMQLLDENPENRPTFRQIVSLFLTKKEKTWLDNVNEDEIEKFLHGFGLTIKPFNPDIDLNFIRSIDVDKYPENAKQPKMTIEEIMYNETISSKIKNDIQLAEKYLNLLIDKHADIDIKEIRRHLFNIGYQFCMGDKEASKNIQEDYFYAIKYLKEAALLGDKTSLYLLASLLSNNQNTLDVAFKLADISADLGCSEAFNLIAVFYKNGIAVQSNIIMAAIYFKIAADKGDVSSMFQFANIMLLIGQKEINSSEFNKQLEIAHDIIKSIDGKCNRVYKEIRYTLEAIENVDVALFVSGKYFEMAALNGNDEAKKVMRSIDVNSSYNHDHPEFYDDIYQALSLD